MLCCFNVRMWCLTSALPEILSPLQDLVITAGENLKLTCNISADPPAIIRWTKDSSQKIPRASLLNNNFTLMIETVEISDDGNYSCVAINRQGNASSSACCCSSTRYVSAFIGSKSTLRVKHYFSLP